MVLCKPPPPVVRLGAGVWRKVPGRFLCGVDGITAAMASKDVRASDQGVCRAGLGFPGGLGLVGRFVLPWRLLANLHNAHAVRRVSALKEARTRTVDLLSQLQRRVKQHFWSSHLNVLVVSSECFRNMFSEKVIRVNSGILGV